MKSLKNRNRCHLFRWIEIGAIYFYWIEIDDYYGSSKNKASLPRKPYTHGHSQKGSRRCQVCTQQYPRIFSESSTAFQKFLRKFQGQSRKISVTLLEHSGTFLSRSHTFQNIPRKTQKIPRKFPENSRNVPRKFSEHSETPKPQPETFENILEPSRNLPDHAPTDSQKILRKNPGSENSQKILYAKLPYNTTISH